MAKNYTPRTVKLENEDDLRLKKICEMQNIDVSTFMREAILSKMNSGAISNVAGKNKIKYNLKYDLFDWVVELDDGKEIEVLNNLSAEFVNDLLSSFSFELNKRNELLGKKKKSSIALPKKLAGGR